MLSTSPRRKIVKTMEGYVPNGLGIGSGDYIMKTRNGFVSNSSSSSFMVAVQGELTEERVLEALQVSRNSPLYWFAKDIAERIVVEAGRDSVFHTVDDLREDVGKWYKDHPADFQEYYAQQIRLLETGYTILNGSFDDGDSESVECWLCYNGISFSGPGLIVDAPGGY